MIKPGTICMIRGVPKGNPGHEFNGNIIMVNGFKKPDERIYWIEPELIDRNGYMFNGCREQWLYPFDDYQPEITTNITKELEKV